MGLLLVQVAVPIGLVQTLIMERIRRVLSPHTWISLLFIFGAVFLSYGIYIPWLGIYGDDWQYLYVFHLMGPAEYGNFVMADRPFSAWVYWLYTPIVGEHFLGYHLILLLLKFGAAIAFWWVIKHIWDNKPWQATWAAVLFAIYPTFKQQPIPLEFVLHFTVLILFLLSIRIMIASVDSRKPWGWLTMVGVLCASGMFSVEYFVGLELTRPLIIWLKLNETSKKKKLVEVIKYWFPYGLVLMTFFYWRVFIYKFQAYKPVVISELASKPAKVIIDLFWRIIQDMVSMVFRVWGQAFEVTNSYPVLFLQGAIILAGSLLVYFAFRWGKNQPGNPPETIQENWGHQVILAGLVLMGLAGIPFWVTDIQLWLVFPWDRTTLPFIPGACLVVIGLVETLLQPKYRFVFLAALVGLSFSIHYQNNLSFINEWRQARSLLWELTWRAPMIKAGTTLVTDGMPLNYYGDNTLSPAINWTYAPDWHQPQIPYRLFDLNIRQGSSTFANLGRNMPIEHNYRSFLFKGSTDQMITVVFKQGACVRVYGKNDLVAPETSDRIKDSLYLSDLKIIDPSPAKPAVPPLVAGPEPEHGWCYYFEKADLARQQEDWKTIGLLGDQVQQAQLVAQSASEYLVFIEGYAKLQRWDEASQLTLIASQESSVKPQLCSLWQQIMKKADVMSEQDKSKSDFIIKQLECDK